MKPAEPDRMVRSLKINHRKLPPADYSRSVLTGLDPLDILAHRFPNQKHALRLIEEMETHEEHDASDYRHIRHGSGSYVKSDRRRAELHRNVETQFSKEPALSSFPNFSKPAREALTARITP